MSFGWVSDFHECETSLVGSAPHILGRRAAPEGRVRRDDTSPHHLGRRAAPAGRVRRDDTSISADVRERIGFVVRRLRRLLNQRA